MDATENDLPAGTPFQVQGFPTIKFIKADGTIIDYNGDRSLADFKRFIDDNSTDFDLEDEPAEEEAEEKAAPKKDEL